MDQLLEEASLWFARMRGPDAEAYRPEFEKWLSLGAAHLGAYNRAGEVFAIGRFLAHEKSKAPASTPYAPETPWRIYAISAVLVLGLGVAGWVGFSRPGPDRAAEPVMSKVAVGESRSYSTVGTTSRSVTLPDGSVVALEAGTILRTQYDNDRRELRLERGSARFDVAHERRPFTVSAGGGRVTARGTLFDVSLASPGRVVVRLLRGAIDVERPARSISSGQPVHSTVTRLSIGDELSFALPVQRLGETEAGSGIPATDNQPEFSLVREFDGTPLSAVVSETNRDSLTAIRLADPSIGNLKVSGRFRVDSPEQVAGRLASLFDLEAKREAPNMIVLRRR